MDEFELHAAMTYRLSDAFGREVYRTIEVPYCEFGQHSLERDYF